MEIYNPDSSFDFNSITLANPQPVQGGSFFTKLSVDTNKPLYIQLPKCVTKQNIVEAMRGKYCDLMFERTDQDELMNWIEKFEIACQDKINSKKSLWFQSELTRDDIESMMSPITRLFKSGKYILIRSFLNTNKYTGKDKCLAYNENEISVDLDSINGDKQIIPLVLIDGIKFSSRSFEIEIKLIQIMVIDPPVIKEKIPLCLIKNNKNINNSTSEKIISSIDNLAINHESKMTGYSIKETLSLNDTITPLQNNNIKNNISSNKNSTLSNQSNHLVDNLKQSNHLVDNLKQSNQSNHLVDNLKQSNHLVDNLKNGKKIEEFSDIEEVNLDINEIKETITLKKPNDVYYEIYKAAREKAKHMRKVAMEAYLEAKQIKTKYMLSDIEDSEDDSEYHEENDL
jgi:hypothetical protein